MARYHGLTVLAWSPLANGLLTGKYLSSRSSLESASSRLNSPHIAPDWTLHRDRAEDVARSVLAIAERLAITPAQVSLAWIRQQGPNFIPVIGARNLQQFTDNLSSLEVVLDRSILSELDQITEVDLGFPQTFLNRKLLKNLTYAGQRDNIQTDRFLF